MVDKFVNKDGKEVLIIDDENNLFIDKTLKDKKKKKEEENDAAEGKVLPKDETHSSDS